jgi:uncharacterized membrane protein YedE/YeeE
LHNPPNAALVAAFHQRWWFSAKTVAFASSVNGEHLLHLYFETVGRIGVLKTCSQGRQKLRTKAKSHKLKS